jgi:hypothetical protein
MKTVIQIIIEQRSKLSQNDFDTWILSNKKELLEKEKEQIMTANIEGTEHGYRERALFGLDARPYSKKRAEQYYNQTFNQNK